ncbi:MAG TPA: MFS transporter [Armatimonadota bacterium]|jgi:MFS family permease
MSAPANRTKWGLSPTVWLLGFVSLLNDISSEIVYPMLPAFLRALGAGPLTLGVIESGAEAIPSVLKGYFGRMADRAERRKALAGSGYLLSGIGKAVLTVAAAPAGVLVARWTDRLGKGVRTSARDAMISAVTPKEQMGRAFGVHRAMDTAGATLGPLAAWLFLRAHPLPVVADFRLPFAVATVFGLAGTALLFFGVKDRVEGDRAARVAGKGPLPRAYWGIVAAAVVFALGNSSDTFLLWHTGRLGVSPANVALIYAGYNAIYAAASTPMGAIADRIGGRAVLMGGYVVFAGVYLGFALAHSVAAAIALWAVYGLYIAATDGVQKAFVARVTPADRRGSAFGYLGMAVGVSALPASLIAGLLYQRYGAGAAFGLTAALAVAAVVLLAFVPRTAEAA